MASMEEEIILSSNNTIIEEDIYFDTYDVDTTGATPRTMPEPPAHYHPIIKTMHRYFISLFYEIEDFFANHWGYFLIGFGLFVLLVIIPGIITQIYCDRLYRKYKREQITRKILQYEAQMEKDSEPEDDDDDEYKRASSRAKKDYSSDSVSEISAGSSRRSKGRGRGRSKSRSRSKSQKRHKTGKKVRSRSRPARKHRTHSSEESEATASIKHEVQVKFASKQKATKSSKMKKQLSTESTDTRKTKSTGVDPLPIYADHVHKEKKFEELRKQRDSGVSMWDAESVGSDYYSEPTGTIKVEKFGNRYNDQPPTYSSDNGNRSAAIHDAHQFPTMTTTQQSTTLASQFTVPDFDNSTLPHELPSLPFQAARATGAQTSLPFSHAEVPRLKEEPLKPNDHRVGYWSAGIVSQYNGVRTPPLPAKHQHHSPLQNIAEMQGATAITYEEIRLMKQHQIHDPTKRMTREPTDYNSALLSITQANDDILTDHRPKTGALIANLMPAPEPREPVVNPPALPPKTKTGIKTVSRLPSLDLSRTMHDEGVPSNSYDGEIVDHHVKNIKSASIELDDKMPRTKSITSRQSIRDIVKDINQHNAFLTTAIDEPETPSIESEKPYIKPKTTFIEPETTFIEPETPTIKPETTFIEPETTFIEPETPSIAPSQTSTMDEGSDSISESVSGTETSMTSLPTTLQTSCLSPTDEDTRTIDECMSSSAFDIITPMAQMSPTLSSVSNRTAASIKTAKTILTQPKGSDPSTGSQSLIENA